MTTDEILGTQISTAASDLLRTARLLSDAPIQFRFGADQELGGQNAGLAKSRTQTDGSAEIVLPRDFNECMLAHEIMHVVLKRRGIPQVVKWPHLEGPFTLLVTHLEDAMHHPSLFHELRARGFDDRPYWRDFVDKVGTWEGSDSTKASEAIGRAFLISELITLSTESPASVIEARRKTHPISVELGEAVARPLQPDNGMLWSRSSKMRRAALRVLRYLTERCCAAESDFPDLREHVGVTMVATKGQISSLASKNIILAQIDGFPRSVVVRSVGDDSLCEASGQVAPAVVGQMFDTLDRVTLGNWLTRFGVRHVVEG